MSVFARMLCMTLVVFLEADAEAYTIDVETIVTHDDGKSLWFHPRAVAIPEGPGKGTTIITLQQHLHKSDFYSGLYTMVSTDNGVTWSPPTVEPNLAWEQDDAGATVGVCDVTPGWHAPTGKVLAIGAKVRYLDGVQIYDKPQSRAGGYTSYDPATKTWEPWRYIQLPEAGDVDSRFYNVTPGCVQWLTEDDGSVLVPIYFSPAGGVNDVTVLRCTFDGEALTYVEHGDELSLDIVRGFVEPSLAKVGDRYFLTIRNDEGAYVTSGDDGLHWAPPKAWVFDDGELLGSYNTQQHWLTHDGNLYLTYTRRGADNDHLMRHRAPLFIAQVDMDALHVIRDTERVLIPENGATLGNFGACAISADESWVTVSEGVWNDDMRKRGATGATFIARIRW